MVKDAMVCQPVTPDDPEADEEAESIGPELEQSIWEFGGRGAFGYLRDSEIQGQEGYGDGEDGVAEEHRTLDISAAFGPVFFRSAYASPLFASQPHTY